MPGRKFSAGGSYRYGFNTQEKDNEIAGEGNHYTALYWEYDPRTGRRWNLDPVALADESEYVVNGNNPLFYVDPYGNFKTKFGAKVYKFFHGGDVGQVKKGDNAGEWYVSKKLENLQGKKGQGNELDEVVVGVKRTFGWNNKAGDAIDATADWVHTTDFVVEGKAKVSLGVQLGVSGNLWGVQGKVEGGVQTYDMFEAKYDVTENKGYAGASEQRVHNFFGAEAKLWNDKLRLGGKYDYTYLYYNGYYGPRMVDGTAVHDWTVSVPFKNFGPKVKILDNLISTQMKASATTQNTNGKTFYGLDVGAGAKLILGIDLKLKIGFNR
jgi:hypothetical protein